MGWYIDRERMAEVSLKPRARVIVEMMGFGEGPPVTKGTFEPIMQLLETDVLMHTDYPALSDRIAHLRDHLDT